MRTITGFIGASLVFFGSALYGNTATRHIIATEKLRPLQIDGVLAEWPNNTPSDSPQFILNTAVTPAGIAGSLILDRRESLTETAFSLTVKDSVLRLGESSPPSPIAAFVRYNDTISRSDVFEWEIPFAMLAGDSAGSFTLTVQFRNNDSALEAIVVSAKKDQSAAPKKWSGTIVKGIAAVLLGLSFIIMRRRARR